jgi:hypothetical protein
VKVPVKCIYREGIVDPRQIYYLCFLMEAYEGLASVTTLDRRLGRVRVHVAPGCERDVESIIESERERLKWREIEAEPVDFDSAARRFE